MKYCKKCVMPDTRPGIKFNEEGICYPCLSVEKRKEVDWDKRWKELEKLADKYRGCNGDYYDCIIAASSGKDSHYQTHVFKERLGLNPLLVTVDNFSWTETGRLNQQNISERFGVDIHLISINRKIGKIMTRKGFEAGLIPNWYWDKAVYAYPLKAAIRLGIQLVVYGENIGYEYGGPNAVETPSALEQINNDVVKPIDWDFWLDENVTMKDLNPAIYPTSQEISDSGLNPIYLSYYEAWDDFRNAEFAIANGFKTLEKEWKREGYIEDYAQIDTIGYNVHPWFKFVKFGHAVATDMLSRWIRCGKISREEAVKLVNEVDWKLDSKMLQDFLDFTGYTEKEFWNITDKFANTDILEKRDGVWRLKKPCH